MKTIITTCLIFLSLTNIGFACKKCTQASLCAHAAHANNSAEACGCTTCEKKSS